MISINSLKYITLFFFTSCSSLTFATNSCVSLLKLNPENKAEETSDLHQVKMDRRSVLTQEIKALEVLAALALSLELNPDISVFRPSTLLNKVRNNIKYPSILRIHKDDLDSYNPQNYDFTHISDADKAHIVDNLPLKMMALVSSSKVGKKFDENFGSDAVYEILSRKSEDVKLLLETKDGFNAIVLNALKNLSRPPLTAKFSSVVKNGFKYIVTGSVVLGFVAELFIPNFAAAIIFDPLFNGDLPIQGFAPDLLKSSYEFSNTMRVSLNTISFAALGAAVAVPISFFTQKNGRFDKTNYDFSYGEPVRDELVNLHISDEFESN